MEKQYFGTDKNGNEIFKYTLTDEKGNSLSVLNYGATIQSLIITDKNGVKKDVVLGLTIWHSMKKMQTELILAQCAAVWQTELRAVNFILKARNTHWL